MAYYRNYRTTSNSSYAGNYNRTNRYQQTVSRAGQVDRNRSAYIEGNTARQLAAEPRRRVEERPERQVHRRPKQEPIQMPEIHKASVFFLMLAVAAVCTICVLYISTENSVQKQKDTIVQMQSNIADMKETNKTDYQNILDSVDLSEVYRKATQDLGMVHASKKQIYTYEDKESDMVKQYGEIPDVN